MVYIVAKGTLPCAAVKSDVVLEDENDISENIIIEEINF